MAPMAHIYPLRILVASLAGLLNRRQTEVLEYLIEGNRVVKEQVYWSSEFRLPCGQRRHSGL